MRKYEGWTFRRWRTDKRSNGRRYVYIRVESPFGELKDLYCGRAGKKRPPGRPRKGVLPDSSEE